MKGIGLWQFILFVVYGIRDILMLYHLLLDVVLAMEEVIDISYLSTQQVESVFAPFLSRQLKRISWKFRLSCFPTPT